MTMSRARAERPGTFLWQGTLLVLPVIVLAAIGVFSLHQDRVLARHEATERAQGIAEDLASGIWSELARTNSDAGSCAFEIDPSGALIFPRPYPPVPLPHRLDQAELDVHQARLWSAARAAEMSAHHHGDAITAYHKLIESQPPPDFRAAARYALGVLLEAEQQDEGAMSNLTSLVAEDRRALGESGLPLAPMAELKLLTLAEKGQSSSSHAVLLEMVCSNAVSQPTVISPELLRVAGEQAKTKPEKQIVTVWQTHWKEQELGRNLYKSAHERLGELSITASQRAKLGEISRSIRLFWISGSGALSGAGLDGGPPASSTPHDQGDAWLAIVVPETSNSWVRCLDESAVGERTSSAIANTRRLPDYLGLSIELAGRKLNPQRFSQSVSRDVDDARRDQPGSTLLAAASPRDTGGADLRVDVYLTSQAALFQRQNARTFWFGSLVAAAALAALAGFVAAYHAFHRQLRLSEMKSNFVSSVSHELRAPIASVRLMAESLERGKVPEPPRQQEYFRFIVQECRRLSALIENVLDFSRIEQGRKEYEFEPTDIVALTNQTVRLMEPYASERGVALQFTLSGGQQTSGPCDIAVDGKAIQQALINLIDNAIKHSPKGQSVKVGVNFEPDAANTGLSAAPSSAGTSLGAIHRNPSSPLRLWVEDHGEGIPAAEQEKIFERFYRRGSELRRETSGVGIGLSIVKHIVEAHGGNVAVRSDVGQGSRFTICLPVSRSVAANKQL